ncbi:MAG: hypothetical protein Ta2E_01960 [Mycoplasmoidaceae bacterium]|nr:MAG: hypothetical protein Ta2E_01960 [Mycoplasmoidaceae bacterium]
MINKVYQFFEQLKLNVKLEQVDYQKLNKIIMKQRIRKIWRASTNVNRSIKYIDRQLKFKNSMKLYQYKQKRYQFDNDLRICDNFNNQRLQMIAKKKDR